MTPTATTTATTERIRAVLRGLPRVRLAELPTPLTDCPRLSAELAGPRIFVKRDDLTGLAFGGNKVRQHEYVLGAALAQGADCLVQGAAAQSNHSRQLAAAGARLGLETFLLPKLDSRSRPVQGNFLVDHLLGATILPIEPGESSIAAKTSLVERLRAEGRRPYVTGMGSDEALAIAAIAYLEALFEIIDQLPPGTRPDAIYTASQGSTQVGLMIACELLGLDTRIVGIAPLGAEHEAYIPVDGIVSMAHAAAGMVGVSTEIAAGDVELRGEFVGEGYGIPTAAGIEAIRLLGRLEGILLDPVYTAKAFSGLVSDVRSGRFGPDDTVVFLHTGGLPALFAYAEPVLATLDPL
jgi:1-aminocyclopropane-1-carboxylate deaminase/D-cysteine desulfhydrase-like pyridoxal-dependent ACC family enzyme